jgi:predicted amidohydrolase
MSHAPGASTRAVGTVVQVGSDWKVGLVQFPVRGCSTVQTLLTQMAEYICVARDEGAELVVFPELMAWELIDESRGQVPNDLRELADKVWPIYADGVRKMAAQYKVPILAGTFPRLTNEGVVNTALMQFPNRTILQDKLLLTPEERDMGWVAGKRFEVFETPWGRTAMLVCYDCQSPRLSAALSAAEPDLILVPSMTGEWGFHRVRLAARALAVSHHCYVAATGVVDALQGPPQGFSGQAAVFTPMDQGFPGLAAEGEKGVPGLTFGEVSFSQLRASRGRDNVVWAGRDERVHARYQ